MMLKVNDYTAVHSSYLSSDRLYYYFKDVEVQSNNVSNVYENAILDYQPYLSRNLRKDDVSAMLKLHSIGQSETSIRIVLSKLADYYLQWQGNCFEVKPEMLSEWLELLTLTDSSWIISQAYIDLNEHYEFSAHEISHCIETYQCPFALPRMLGNREFADNHVHLGGHGYLGPSLLSFCLYGELPSEALVWPKKAEY
ncbi:hypothetical protein [Vibrio scophthalmi]|uniref:Uncharacterized protein n=1 Tax=Vibrio scophthalmi TaxID=45658 RepID=A0A1C7FE57_9VIBR|nr:hypothetical protein [Vibrio scophthalmi]ANU38201.1 hypothetical protein VSVS05_03163 [Vibrio scophthalmi]